MRGGVLLPGHAAGDVNAVVSQRQGQIQIVRQGKLCFRRPEIVGAGDGIKLFSLFTAPAEFTQTIVDVIADQFAGDQMKTDRDAPGKFAAQ